MESLAVADELQERVRELTPVAGLAPHFQNQIVTSARFESVARGEAVFREGDNDGYAYYLLEGCIELSAHGQLIKRVEGGSDDARNPLAQLKPRQMTAVARRKSMVARLPSDLLDKLVNLGPIPEGPAVEVGEIGADDEVDWMTRLLQSPLFTRIPASSIQGLFARLEELEFHAGDIVVSQGEVADGYFILKEGRCEVERRAGGNARPLRLATLVPGDTFGEEALVSGSPRNASVRMLTDGLIGRLDRDDFQRLVQAPLLRAMNYVAALEAVAGGASLIDVRFPEEHERDGLPDSECVPLNQLRMRLGKRDESVLHICVCNDGRLSQAAAFLLAERGFNAAYLAGGMNAVSESGATDFDIDLAPPSSEAAPELVDSKPLLDEDSDEPTLHYVPVPASMLSEDERSGEAARAVVVPLSAELSEADAQLVEARALRDATEQARADGAGEARLTADAQAAAQLLAEAEELKASLEAQREASIAEAKQRAEAQARRIAELKKAAEAELAERARSIEASRLAQKQKLAQIRALEEQTRERIAGEQAAAEAQLARSRAEAEQALAQEREAVAQRLAEQRTELARIEKEKEAAAEVARLRAAEEARLADLRTQAAEEREALAQEQARLKTLKDEGLRAIEAERARMKAELEADAQREAEAVQAAREARLAEIEREAEAARAELEKAQADEQARLVTLKDNVRVEAEAERARLKAQLEAEAEAEREAERTRIEEEMRAHRETLAEEARSSLAAEEARLREEFDAQAKALAELRDERARMEAEIAGTRAELEAESAESKQRLREARDAERALEDARREAEREAAARDLRQRQLREALAAEGDEALASRRAELEAEFARNAEQLEKARAERAAAERAREAAAAEARRLADGYREAFEKIRAQEEARLELERRQLDEQARQLATELEQARVLRAEAEAARGRAAKAEQALRAQSEAAASAADLSRVREEAAAADALFAEAASVEARTSEAMARHDVDMARYAKERDETRAHFESEIEQWLEEREAEQNSDVQQSILANQKAHMARIKERARLAREAAKRHDQTLIDDLAKQLRGEDGPGEKP